MTVHIALMRGIHVGGRDRITAFNLRAFLCGPDCADSRALLRSGNLVFSSQGRTAAELEYLMEVQAGRRIGMHTGFVVRTANDWEAIIARNPFPAEAERDPGRLAVMLLKNAPDRAAVEALREAAAGPEAVRVEDRQVYVTYPTGIGRSRLTGTLIESALATRGTARSWRTVLKLAALARLTAP